MKIIESFGRRNKYFWVVAGLILIAGVGFIDYMTGYELSFSLFYLIPISLLAWFTGRRFGIAASLISAFVWLIAEITAGRTYTHPAIYFWNSSVRFSFFIIVTLLLATLGKMLKREKELSSIDYLTKAVNSRLFSEILQNEIERSRRHKHPFTLAYIDLDNFKTINDIYGHSIGDRVLFTVVNHARGLLRKTDTIVRLGGDEFAFLMPETDQEVATAVISRIQISLLDEMEKNNWPVTFSIGALIFIETPPSSDEANKLADDLMYAVKNHGKNAIKISIYTEANDGLTQG